MTNYDSVWLGVSRYDKIANKLNTYAYALYERDMSRVTTQEWQVMSDLLTLIFPGYFQDYLCTILMCFANSVFTLGKGRVKKK